MIADYWSAYTGGKIIVSIRVCIEMLRSAIPVFLL